MRRDIMRTITEPGSWAVYRIAAAGKDSATNAMCDQADWAELERIAGGRNTLIRGNIASEVEAELLARGTTGDVKPRGRLARRPGDFMGELVETPPLDRAGSTR